MPGESSRYGDKHECIRPFPNNPCYLRGATDRSEFIYASKNKPDGDFLTCEVFVLLMIFSLTANPCYLRGASGRYLRKKQTTTHKANSESTTHQYLSVDLLN
ncbi:hypothetical protein QN372_01340 [Undibacterium sp. RTI2.1]|uniref:hypothetical protein n=1 Tax=unclassified Undibacterium TaxID=2630295 RepID=UPI002AB50BC3|nr:MULTISPECIES: hypothetical protein [unclassified Undibacterium]MDY7539829.1 hypothetical protein [Undibacterium sp. 5I1]MEB0029382.1 hypothetical protein [Undibacterium sp. RTI2.1]MEB0115999.1 hypothetical protein [Undibacterium sp. RTI2.2]MEB0232118.1 hypothetical protein [Undibacterium sp. 10I3]MEB0256865.1 hypothetical protein [Undibacterium sp. 5I1]